MEYGSQLLFFLTIGYIALSVFYTSENDATNVKSGLIGAALVVLAQSTLQPYKSPFRIRASLTRVIARIGLIYLAVLVFLLFQRPAFARYLFWHVDEKLNTELAARTENYNRDCSFTLDNVLKISDFYVVAHFVNWLLAAFIIRDYYVLHIWSALDEVIELSLKHIRPNFAECWWDSLILDFLLANTLGIYVGMQILKLAGSDEYDWFGRKGRAFKDWKAWTCFRHFQGVFLVIVFVSLNFVTGFTVPNSLWVPPNHWTNAIRLVIWMLMGGLGFREAYDDVKTWGSQFRKSEEILAQHRWESWMIQCCELMLTWKFRHNAGNLLDQPFKWGIFLLWGIAIAACLGYYFYLRLLYKYRIRKDGSFIDPSVQKKDK